MDFFLHVRTIKLSLEKSHQEKNNFLDEVFFVGQSNNCDNTQGTSFDIQWFWMIPWLRFFIKELTEWDNTLTVEATNNKYFLVHYGHSKIGTRSEKRGRCCPNGIRFLKVQELNRIKSFISIETTNGVELVVVDHSFETRSGLSQSRAEGPFISFGIINFNALKGKMILIL